MIDGACGVKGCTKPAVIEIETRLLHDTDPYITPAVCSKVRYKLCVEHKKNTMDEKIDDIELVGMGIV